MAIPHQGCLLRIFIGESDKHDGKPLYEWIVRQARKSGLAGATVTRGIEGFGRASRIHTAKILRLSEDLPIIVEIVDAPEKIETFIKVVDPVIDGGLVTVENVQVRVYRSENN
jgi:PII-like signaling protein